VSTRTPASATSRWSIKAMRPLLARPVHVREERTWPAVIVSPSEKVAGDAPA
jgi:hypothetical protein